MRITGSTRVLFCIADPVDQVRAPEVFNEVFARHGVDAAMVPLRVRPAEFRATVRALAASDSFGGISLSIPHKVAALEAVQRVLPGAHAAQAINAIRRTESGVLEGDLFDGLGFIRGLDRAGLPYRGKRVLMLGAGGAAAALAVALANGGVDEIAFYDPAPGRAGQLAARMQRDHGLRAAAASGNDPAGYDLIVNASPVGLRSEDPAPVDVQALPPHAAVCDILMKNQPTPLVRGALARGLRALPGFEMLIQQTPAYLEFFGYPELAAAVRHDDGYLRDLLVPAALREDARAG